MSNPELERQLRQLDQDMLMYDHSIQHLVNTPPQEEVEIRRIDPRSTMVNGINTRTLSLYEAGELYPEFVNYMSIDRYRYSITSGLANNIIYYGAGGIYYGTGGENVTTDVITNLITRHTSKYHKYIINEYKNNDKTKFTVKTPTKLFSIETKNKFEYNKALQDAKQGWFKNWKHG